MYVYKDGTRTLLCVDHQACAGERPRASIAPSHDLEGLHAGDAGLQVADVAGEQGHRVRILAQEGRACSANVAREARVRRCVDDLSAEGHDDGGEHVALSDAGGEGSVCEGT